MVKFYKKHYDAADCKAKTAWRNHLEKKGVYTNVFEDYKADIKALHPYFHEVEIKSSWEDTWPETWKTLHIPARKKKYLKEGDGYFIVLNRTCTKAKIVESKHMANEYIENICNRRYPEGEPFYNIPIDLTEEVTLSE